MVSDCVMQCVKHAKGKIFIQDDVLACEVIDDVTGEIKHFSLSFIDRLMCQPSGIEIIKEGSG